MNKTIHKIIIAAMLLVFWPQPLKCETLIFGNAFLKKNHVCKIIEKTRAQNEKKDKKTAEYICDENGKISESLSFDNFENLSRKNKYVYDGGGNELETLTYENDSLTERRENSYDKNFRLVETRCFDGKGVLIFSRLYGYDKNGRKNSVSKIDGARELENYSGASSALKRIKKEIYDYDARGNISKITYYEDESKLSNEAAFTYNAKGWMAEKRFLDRAGSLIDRTEFIYDDKTGLLSGALIYSQNKPESKRIYEYEFFDIDNPSGAAAIADNAKTSSTRSLDPETGVETMDDYEAAMLAHKQFIEELKTSFETKNIVVKANDTERIPQQKTNTVSAGVNNVLFTINDENYETVQRALNEKCIDINMQNKFGASILMAAAYLGHENTVKYLIEKGANLDHKDKKGRGVDYYLKKTRNPNGRINDMLKR